MPDLPDYYTQAAIAEAEAAGLKGGLAANRPDEPVSRDIYLGTDNQVLYVCFTDGEWTGFNAAMLTKGILTLYENLAGGGKRITNIDHPVDAQDATTKSYVLARIALEATARGIAIGAEATARAAADALRLLLTGGTMSGNIAMGTKKLTGLGAPTAQNDSLRYGQAEIRNAEIAAAAAIVYTKLNLTGALKKGDIEAAAGIEYSKLALAASIVMADLAAAIKNAANGIVVLDASGDVPLAQLAGITNTEIAAAAAIVYSKLNLTGAILMADLAAAIKNAANGIVVLDGSGDVPLAQLAGITNTEIAAAAAIVYSKLNLTGNIVNADIAAAAAIAYSKLNLTGLIVMADLAAAIQNAANGIVVLDASADVPDAQIPNLAASKITSLRFPVDRLPAMTDEKIWKGTGTNVEEVDMPSGWATLTVCDVEVFNDDSPSPAAWTDLDLSGTVGANAAFVILRAYASTGTDYPLSTRPDGETDVTLQTEGLLPFDAKGFSSQWGFFIGLTNASGVLEWKYAGTQIGVTINLIAYIK